MGIIIIMINGWKYERGMWIILLGWKEGETARGRLEDREEDRTKEGRREK